MFKEWFMWKNSCIGVFVYYFGKNYFILLLVFECKLWGKYLERRKEDGKFFERLLFWLF